MPRSWSRGLVIGNKGKEELSSCSFVTGVDDHARRTVDLPQRDAAAPTAPRGAPCPHRKYQHSESPCMAAWHSIGVGSFASAARAARVAFGDPAGEQTRAPMRPLCSNDAIGTSESRRDYRKKTPESGKSTTELGRRVAGVLARGGPVRAQIFIFCRGFCICAPLRSHLQRAVALGVPSRATCAHMWRRETASNRLTRLILKKSTRAAGRCA